MAVHGFQRQLEWSDFREVEKSLDGKHDAGFQPRYGWNCRTLTDRQTGDWRVTSATVSIQPNSANTWVVKGKKSNELLIHEQGHYDICAIGARMIEAKLRALTGRKAESSDLKVDATGFSVAGKRAADGQLLQAGLVDQVQDLYDSDPVCGTDHSRDKTNQAIWTIRIKHVHADPKGTLEDLNFCIPASLLTPFCGTSIGL